MGTRTTIQTLRYEVTIEVPNEPLLDDHDRKVLETSLLAAVEKHDWGVVVTVEQAD